MKIEVCAQFDVSVQLGQVHPRMFYSLLLFVIDQPGPPLYRAAAAK